MGGSSSQVVGYRYYAKFAAFIGNRIEKLIGVNFDNRGWIVKENDDNSSSLTIDKPSLYGENEGGVAGIVDIHPGLPDAEPNAEYQKYFPLVSGYPYQSYLVFRGLGGVKTGGGLIGGVIGSLQAHRHDSFYLGNSGYMKEMLLWVQRIHVKNNGDVQWHDLKSEIIGLSGHLIEYQDLSGLSWELIRQPSGVVPNIDKSYVFSPAGDTYNLYKVTVSFDANVETRPVISGIPTESPAVFKDAEYGSEGQLKYWNRYEFEVSDPPQRFILNAGAANDFVASFSGTFSFLVRKGSTFKATAMTGDPGYQGAMNGEYQSIFFTETKIEAYFSASDINPIHKIREILTDDTAMGKPESDVNDANFMKAADRIYDEGLGISWAIDEKSCIEAIEELCYHIEAGIRVNRQTGLYEMVLFRDDWFEEDEIHTIAENKIKYLSLEVMNSDDIVNQLNVTYYDRERIKNSTFSIYENGSILTMGHANAESVEFPYFMNMRNAEIVANWKLKQFSTPAWSGSFSTGWREARKWNRYDLIRLPWSKKWEGTILVRIMKINLGSGTDNTVTIDFEGVIPYSGEMNTSIVVDAPVDSSPQPPQPSINAVFEAPYYLTVLRAGQTNADLELSSNSDIGYVAAIAAKPQNNSLNALLFTDGGMGEFEQVSRLDYCDILQLDQPITEITSSFVVTGSLTQATNSNNLILLNDELMGFVSFDDETKVLTVKRGILDTVPKKHSSGSLFVFDLSDVALDSTQYSQSEIIEAQVLTTTPSDIQELSETGHAVEIQARAIRPYPPAKVKINDAYYPETIIVTNDIVLTWVDRNRLQQTGGTPLGFFDEGVTVEQGVNYSYELISENVVLDSGSGITENTVTILSSSLIPNKPHTLKLWSVRDGYKSFQVFEHSFFVESASLILTATATKSNIVGSTVPTANVSVVVDEALKANMQADGSSISGKAQAGATITIEVND